MTRHAARLCWRQDERRERDRVTMRDFASGSWLGVLVVGFGARNLGVTPSDSPRVAGESRFNASARGSSGDDRMGRAY